MRYKYNIVMKPLFSAESLNYENIIISADIETNEKPYTVEFIKECDEILYDNLPIVYRDNVIDFSLYVIGDKDYVFE